MPWQPELDELILQKKYGTKAIKNNNFESELITINKELEMEKEFQKKIKHLHEEVGIRKRRSSINSDEYLSPIKNSNPMTPKKQARKPSMKKFKMFQDAEESEKDFKYGSPSKQPLNNNIADPEYKPFERNSQESMYSYPSDNDKTNKSEDDSPHRRKLIRQSSPAKRVKFTSQQQKEKVESILNASAEMDAQLDS